MAKKTKTFNLRLDDMDRARLEKVAAHYSAPLATAVRILIKLEHDRIAKSDKLSTKWDSNKF